MNNRKKLFASMAVVLALLMALAVGAWAAGNANKADLNLVLAPETQLDVYVDGTWSGELSDTYAYGDTATIKAPATSGSKNFSHWTADGSIVSYANPLKLTMNAHTTLYAVYANSVTAKPVAGFTSITRTNDGKSISFQAIASGTSAGIVYSTTATGNNLKIDGTGVTKVEAAPLTDSTATMPDSVLDSNNCWMLQITPTSGDTVYHARAYVTVSGTTTYGDVKDVKLSDLQSGVSLTANLDGIDPQSDSTEQTDLTNALAHLANSMRTVTFDANGGTGTMAPQGVVSDTATKLNANTFTREGYTFSGWSTNKNGGGTTYTDGQSVTLTADTTLYAQWKSNYSGSSSSGGSSSNTTTTTTTRDNTSNPDASTTNGTVTVTTTKNADGSTTAKTTETATVAGENGSKTEVKAESSTTTKSNTDGSTTATTTATQTATTTAADGSKTVTETKTEAKETLDKSGNGTVEGKTTETVKDASGKVTATTVTESKGTVSTATDGTKTTTTTNTAVTTAADGTKTTVITTEKAVETTDGSTGKVVSDESGKVVAVEAKVSETAAESAAKSGEAVTLPVTVTAAQSAENATAVEITVPKDAESVKVEIPVEDVKPGTVAIIVHEDGTEEIVKTSTTSGNGVVLALESGASVKVVDNTRTFNDVSGSEWYADNVTWAASREVMNGVGDNTFAPNEDTNRAMVTQILYNLDSGKADGAIPTFSDVSANDWYADSVTWAVSNGVARGEGSSFGANDAVTREQLAVMLYNYADMKGYRTTDRGDMSRFADNGRTSSWATDAMAWAVGVGILNGSENADGSVSLNPQGNASRAQVTAMTERFCGKAAK